MTMLEKLELISESDIQRLNKIAGPFGITAEHDLFGAPVIYIDHSLLDRCRTGVKERNRLTDAQIEQILQMHNSGSPYREIARTVKVSLGSISRIIQENSNH